jgi:hypothetical protein
LLGKATEKNFKKSQKRNKKECFMPFWMEKYCYDVPHYFCFSALKRKILFHLKLRGKFFLELGRHFNLRVFLIQWGFDNVFFRLGDFIDCFSRVFFMNTFYNKCFSTESTDLSQWIKSSHYFWHFLNKKKWIIINFSRFQLRTFIWLFLLCLS